MTNNKRKRKPPDKDEESPWMTNEQASDYLQISVSMLHRLKERGAIPSRKLGHLVRYHRQELDEYLLSQQHKVNP
jgi:excisionase family DNA binding protein